MVQVSWRTEEGWNAGRSLRLAPPQRAEAFDFGTCKTPRNADGIARWCLKALPRNSDGTNHNLKSRIFRQTIQKSLPVAELQARIFVKHHGKGASECANRGLRGIAQRASSEKPFLFPSKRLCFSRATQRRQSPSQDKNFPQAHPPMHCKNLFRFVCGGYAWGKFFCWLGRYGFFTGCGFAPDW